MNMDEEDIDEQEELRAARLQQARQASSQPQSHAEGQGESAPPRISTLEFGLMIGFLGLFFDLPQALLAPTIIGTPISWIIGFFGYLTIYIWLKLKGRSLFDAKRGSKRLFTFWGSAMIDTASGGFLPGLSGCVFGIMVIERLEEKGLKKAL